jgi:hypothetical protein
MVELLCRAEESTTVDISVMGWLVCDNTDDHLP